MYNIGDLVFDTVKNERVKILDRSEVWGFVSYKVYNPSKESIYKISAEQISTTATEHSLDVNYLRYITLLSKIKNEVATGILSNLSSGIIPLPHQIHVLNRAVSNNNIRYILADEVGLGKTIEAGLIIKELKTRGLINRVLIVCPKGLVTQWNLEMTEKFGEKFHVIFPEDYETIKKNTDSEDVYGQFDQDTFNHIRELSKEFAYETFLEMKADFEKKNEEIYGKYLYVIELRIEAAKNIGIENIRVHKLKNLIKEKVMVEEQYKVGKLLCPEFKPIFMAYLEG